MVYTTASILPFQLCISRSRVGRTERIEKKVNLPDVVVGPQTNPLGDRTVLLLGFGKLLLGAETLVALYEKKNLSQQPSHGNLPERRKSEMAI